MQNIFAARNILETREIGQTMVRTEAWVHYDDVDHTPHDDDFCGINK